MGRDQQVSVELYNAAGQLLRTVFTGKLTDDGPHDFNIATSYLASGMYVVQVRGEFFEEGQRLRVE